jgi:hypothetical protein
MEIARLTFYDPSDSLRQFLGLTVVMIEYMTSLLSAELISVPFGLRVGSMPPHARFLPGQETP